MTVNRVRPESDWGVAKGAIGILVMGMVFAFVAAGFAGIIGGSASFGVSIVIGFFVVLGWAGYWVIRKSDQTALFRTTFVSTVGTVDQLMIEEKESNYGTTTKYYLFVSFTTGQGGEQAGIQCLARKKMMLKALVSQDLYYSSTEGQSITVSYATSKPAIALLEGEAT